MATNQVRVRLTGREVEDLLDKYHDLGRRMLTKLWAWRGTLKGLKRAAGQMLAMYVREVDVLTPEKLAVIRRVRWLVDGRVYKNDD